jgi:hypothetical protein
MPCGFITVFMKIFSDVFMNDEMVDLNKVVILYYVPLKQQQARNILDTEDR